MRVKWRLLLLFLSGLLVMTSLYQLEIIFICIGERWWFDLPFYLIRHPDVPVGSREYWVWMSVWRDVFYSLLLLGSFLFGLGMHDPLWRVREKVRRVFRV